MAEPIRFEYRYETRADLHRAFRAMSDTDAFNRAANANMTFTQSPNADGSSVTTGSVSKLGMTVRWQERPFSFRAPHWFSIRRDFDNGPAARMTARATFSQRPGGGTVIDYSLEVLARNAIFRPVVNFDLKRSLEPALRRAIEGVVAQLEQDVELDPERSLLGPAPALKQREAARLVELVSELAPSQLRDRMLLFLRAAPEREQHSMSPITLAQAWIAPLEDVAQLFIDAATIGLLAVRVDLLCPACLVPKAMLDEQGRMPEVHCESCGIPLDPSYPEGLALHFFPSPSIRTLRVKNECIGSPHKTPQIVAQEAVEPGAEVDLATTLRAGTYQLRTMPAVGPAALIDVRDGEDTKSAAFTLRGSLQPQLARLRPEPTSIPFRNASEVPVVVVLERLEPPRRVLSLGRMLVEYPALRKLLPATGFISSMSTFLGVAVAIRALSPDAANKVQSALRRARLTYVSDSVVLAVYADGERSHEDLRELDLSTMLVGVCEGTISESTIGPRSVPVGPAIDDAYAAMCSAGFGRIGRAP
ncbi:MAG: hypothetical protein HOW73_42190 [Polyangiaceae bacterium]|nr:hypothetical protein [Polyangiaceae bacterium]